MSLTVGENKQPKTIPLRTLMIIIVIIMAIVDFFLNCCLISKDRVFCVHLLLYLTLLILHLSVSINNLNLYDFCFFFSFMFKFLISDSQ